MGKVYKLKFYNMKLSQLIARVNNVHMCKL